MTNMKKFSIISAAIIGLYNAPLAMSEGSIKEDLFKEFEASMVTVSQDVLSVEDFQSSMVNVSRGMMTASGDIIHPSEEDQGFQKHLLAQDKASARQGIYGKDLLLNDFDMMDDNGDMDPSFKSHLLAQDQAFADQVAYNNGWSKYAKDTAIAGAKYTGQKVWDTASWTARTVAAWSLNYQGVEALEQAVAYGAYGVGYIASYGNPVVGNVAFHTTQKTIKIARYIVPGFEGYLAGTFAPATKALFVDPAVNLAINYGPIVECDYVLTYTILFSLGKPIF
ncbi:MAG: hypothetical protein ACRYGR_04075 [Janthinobacterium lividum]